MKLTNATEQIRRLIKQDMAGSVGSVFDEDVLDAGHEARRCYGLGSGGARWITRTAELYIAAEKLVAKIAGTPEAMTYPDSFIRLMSIAAALSRPVMGFTKHIFLVPETAPQASWDGLRVASK